MHAYLSHTARSLPADPAALTATLNAWLRWKGAVTEIQRRSRQASCASEVLQVRGKCESLLMLRRDLAALQLSRPEKLTVAEYPQRLAELGQQKEALELELARVSQRFALEKGAGEAVSWQASPISSPRATFTSTSPMSRSTTSSRGPLAPLATSPLCFCPRLFPR